MQTGLTVPDQKHGQCADDNAAYCGRRAGVVAEPCAVLAARSPRQHRREFRSEIKNRNQRTDSGLPFPVRIVQTIATVCRRSYCSVRFQDGFRDSQRLALLPYTTPLARFRFPSGRNAAGAFQGLNASWSTSVN